MPTTLIYRHRSITPEDIDFIRNLIAEHPSLSRWSLSKKLCESWNWVQSNGVLRDMVARGLMLMLHREGRNTFALLLPTECCGFNAYPDTFSTGTIELSTFGNACG